ncbi:protoporphyrinogen oxidase [Bacillus toyonensis]|uniref:Coproporphyrinogen III oxidase n=1 Tax=Bacillus toyonensis TaxID=155322 RepID=A0A2C5NFM1_9BACI|nr:MULTISPECIES: protoporphyrinogen oxidase [Bacillus]EEL23001.1 Protoporphyrinogen oxidase [Bacillus cereus Rock1-3]EEL40424.1 Protoporphyrinogen oxidase [Bacillus cereus Rock3-29]KAB0449205.1 protoporphyrinogen oxidase [Lysinibacillus sp. VIA-II-2016]KNH36206.1 protoporphyrinogen oxidase [Bacillus thuringiensis]KXY18668.1 protoporphyrinogen oxidase [Bacillus cereus]MDH8707931.1 oxygen-dependent protoporphyrinogen oxidase [Stenotrophomonas sp. 1198]
MKTVVVIGGGITGLSTMFYLEKLKKDYNIDLHLILVEKEESLGGKIHSVEEQDFIMESGADSIVARNEHVMPLVKDLNLEEEMVYNETGISYIYSDNILHPIPSDSIFGIPMSVESLFSSTLVSTKGKIVALKDFITKNKEFTKDTSLALFLESFLGKELVERQIAPVLSGVYSGKLNELTMASTLPYLLDYKNKYGSIMKGFEENKKQFQSAGNKKFVSFKSGLSTIINRLEDKLTETVIKKGAVTTAVSKRGDQYEISIANQESIQADYVVLAAPHDIAQTLLQSNELNEHFNKFKNSSLISIYLGFDIPDEQLPADGTGFIVTENSDLHCDACTWTSRKWKHTSGTQKLLVRMFYKSTNPIYETIKNYSEEELVRVALYDIEKSLGIKGEPEVVEVTNWKDLMPKYHLEHNQAVQALNEKLTALYPNVYLAGASYYGVGIGACIGNGKNTAKEIMTTLSEELK